MCFHSIILINEESWFGSTTFGIAQGFRKLGFEIAKSHTGAFVQGRSLPLRLLSSMTKPINIALYNKEILQYVTQFMANTLFTFKGGEILPKSLRTLAGKYC